MNASLLPEFGQMRCPRYPQCRNNSFRKGSKRHHSVARENKEKTDRTIFSSIYFIQKRVLTYCIYTRKSKCNIIQQSIFVYILVIAFLVMGATNFSAKGLLPWEKDSNAQPKAVMTLMILTCKKPLLRLPQQWHWC